MKIKINLVRVFVNEKGKFGNPQSIVFDEHNNLDIKKRQEIAYNNGFSETIFINDKKTGNVTILNPKEECPFAGSALLGTAWFLNNKYQLQLESLLSSGKIIPTWQENGVTYISMKESILPPWNLMELKTPKDVINISPVIIKKVDHAVVWSWINKAKGIIRARTFAPDWGIPEDEANGSGSMKLALKFQQNIIVHHGKGSIVYTKFINKGLAAVGGRVILNKK